MLGLRLNVISTGYTVLQVPVTLSCGDQQQGRSVQGLVPSFATWLFLCRDQCPC
jgi:hypothetical protein